MTPVRPEELIEVVDREHVRDVLAYTTALTGDRATAEDVAQETLVRAWHHRATLVLGQASLRSWLLTTARNVVFDNARRARDVLTGAGDVPVSDHADAVADRVAVRRALLRLRPHHREVLFHLYFEDRSVTQTAACLGVAEGTIKSRRYHAMRALRRELCRGEEAT